MRKTIFLLLMVFAITSCYNKIKEDRTKEIADSLRIADSTALCKQDTCKIIKKECKDE